VRWRNNRGFTALDLIHDYDEWIDCAIFSPDIVARLKGRNSGWQQSSAKFNFFRLMFHSVFRNWKKSF